MDGTVPSIAPELDRTVGGSPAVAHGGSRDLLLLAPLDGDADALLAMALRAGGFAFARRGTIVIVADAHRHLSELNTLLAEQIPPALQARIRGLFLGGSADLPDTIVPAFFEAEPLPTLFEQAEVEWARQAIDEGWLFSVFQPVVETATGAVFGYEALIRARDPRTSETIGAGQLLYACSRLNLQHRLDECARVCAIRAAAALKIDGVRFFINFLPSAIYDPEVCLRPLAATARECGLPMSRLVFEVVDTEQIPHTDRLSGILDFYRRHGAGVALDDISSGFSSMQYLTELVPDYVKIDRNLTTSAVRYATARQSLQSIVDLARKLNVKTVAEGIEGPEQMEVCVAAGVDYMQGYLFAAPAMPPKPVRPDVFPAAQRAA